VRAIEIARQDHGVIDAPEVPAHRRLL